MVPLISEKWTSVLKLLLLVPLFAYAYTLLTLSGVTSVDLLSFGLTLLGSGLVVKAKVDLARHYTWTGFCLDSPKLVAHGIYSYIRHPLYAGVYLFTSGLTLTVILHEFVHGYACLSCFNVHIVFPNGFSFTRNHKT